MGCHRKRCCFALVASAVCPHSLAKRPQPQLISQAESFHVDRAKPACAARISTWGVLKSGEGILLRPRRSVRSCRLEIRTSLSLEIERAHRRHLSRSDPIFPRASRVGKSPGVAWERLSSERRRDDDRPPKGWVSGSKALALGSKLNALTLFVLFLPLCWKNEGARFGLAGIVLLPLAAMLGAHHASLRDAKLGNEEV